MYKFSKLYDKLASTNEDNLVLTENELNDLIDGGLSENAFSSRSYFANDETHAIYRVWKNCGFYCSKVNRYERYIVLTKMTSARCKMLSSDVLYYYFKNDIKADFVIVVTPFSFAEICRCRNIRQEDLKNYILTNNGVFIDFDGKEIPFNSFYQLINAFGGKSVKLYERTAVTYQNIVTYVYATCLVNLDVDINDLILFFETHRVLPIQYFNDFANSHSLRESFYGICNEIDEKIDINELINKIKKIDCKTIQTFMVECSPLELLFYDYALRTFVEELNANDRFVIRPKIVEEMLNVSLLNICQKYIYLTNQSFTADILLGSVKGRVIMQTV